MAHYIGIDIGGMSIKGGVCTDKGVISSKFTLETKEYNEKNSISKDIVTIIDKLIEMSPEIKHFDGVGIGSPGTVDGDRGIIKYSNNIKMQNVKVIEELRAAYKDKRALIADNFTIGNDANCAALGEHLFGRGKGFYNMILVTLGTGVGSGFIIDGRLFEGLGGAGTEAGHTVIRHRGEKCNCERRGCWERYASVSGLIRQTERMMEKHPESTLCEQAKKDGKITGKTAFLCAEAGDKWAKKVVDNYIDYISEGLINLANIFSPEAIIIGGGISQEGEKLTKPLKAKMDKVMYGAKYNKTPQILSAALTNDAGIIGAIAKLCKA